MATELSSAIDAYRSAVGRASGDRVSEISKPNINGANDFTSMVKNFANDAIQKGESSERLSAAAAAGKANIDQVVIAVAEAETTLNTVVAVRDKVLEAYREILRMPI